MIPNNKVIEKLNLEIKYDEEIFKTIE